MLINSIQCSCPCRCLLLTVAPVILDTAHPFASNKHTTSDVVPDKSASMFRCHPKPWVSRATNDATGRPNCVRALSDRRASWAVSRSRRAQVVSLSYLRFAFFLLLFVSEAREAVVSSLVVVFVEVYVPIEIDGSGRLWSVRLILGLIPVRIIFRLALVPVTITCWWKRRGKQDNNWK